MQSRPDRLTVLKAEFETAGKRLAQTNDPDERQTLLRELRQLISEMDRLLEAQIKS